MGLRGLYGRKRKQTVYGPYGAEGMLVVDA
jgi:hypothetical protein